MVSSTAAYSIRTGSTPISPPRMHRIEADQFSSTLLHCTNFVRKRRATWRLFDLASQGRFNHSAAHVIDFICLFPHLAIWHGLCLLYRRSSVGPWSSAPNGG